MHLNRFPSPGALVSAALVSALTLGGVIATGGAAVQAASTITQTFGYTGSTQTFTVPAGVTSITVTLTGGQGGRGGPDYATQNADGYQGVVTGTIAVTPGETITLAVGGGGGDGAGGGSAPGGTAGLNPLAGYDGAVGGVSGPAGSSGGGGGSGAATVMQIDGVDIVAGGAGGNGGNGQYAVLIGRVAEDHHVARPDATSTTGRAGYNTTIACGGTCDGGASGAGGGGAQGGDRGDVQYGGASATEWFGFGGAPGANSTAGYPGLVESYSFYTGNRANGSITVTYDDGAPGIPINLSTTAETDAVALAWNEPATVGASPISDYVVQYATNPAGSWTTVADGVSTSLATQVTGLTNGLSYYFRVAATNTQGTGGYATTALGTVPSDIPGAPTVTGLVPFGGGIHVDFTAAASDAPISGYEYRLDGGAWTSGSVVGTRLTISGLTNGRAYAVEIRALNVIGAGPESTPAESATPSDVPEAPTGLQGVGGDGTLDLSWIAPTVDNGTPVSDYVVQTATSPGGPFTTVYQPGTDATTAFLSGLVNGTTYTVRVAAVNAAGQSAWSATVDVTPYTAPDAPTITLTPGDGSLAVALAGFDGGSDATRYEYQLDGGSWTIASTTTDPFTISGLTNGTSYDVAVRVTNAAGTGPASSDVSGTPVSVPAAPSIAALALDWGAVDVAFEVGSDGGSPLTNVEYSIDGGDHWITRTPASSVSPLQITGLTQGANYEVVVRALNAAGASEPSNVSSVRANGVPDAPEVTLVPGDHSLFVHHTTPANGGSPITGYEYSVDGGTWTPTATLESPFVVTGLDNGVEYEVRVRASNGAGDGLHGTASATPRTVPGAPEIVGGTVAGAEGDLVVDLTAPASDGGSPIVNYGYSTDAGATWRSVTPASAATQITISVLSSDGTTPLTGGVEYPVEIRAMNAAGAGPASAVATGITTDVPDAPTVDDVTRRQGGVTITFVPGANGGATVTQYEYRLGGVAGSWVSTGSLGDTFDIGGLANGPYDLEMRALNAVGYSAVSLSTPFTVSTVPTAPTITGITAGDQSLAVAFTPPADDGGDTVIGYHYSTDGGATWRAFGPGTSSPLTVTTESGPGATPIVNGTLYAVQIRAVNDAGDGQASATRLVAPRGAPDAPTALVVASGDRSLTLEFTLGADGGSPLTAIEYRLDGGAWVPAGSLSSPLTITGLVNGTEYDVAVRAVNAIGAGTATAPAPGTPSAVPGAPVLVTANAGAGSVTAAWQAPADDGGSPIELYTVAVYAESAGGSPLATCTTAYIAGCAVTGLTNGVTVYVDVTASNATGTGLASAPRLARTPMAAPQVSIASVTPAPTELTIGVGIDDLGGAAITGYEYQLDGGAWVSTGSGASPFTVAGLTFGTSYSVRIRATSAAGVGAASAPVTAVPHTVAGAPVSLAAASRPASALLTWSAPVSNGGQPITDYVVQYATNANGPFSTFVDGVSVANTATVTGLVNTTAYVFRVAAVNTAGTGSWSSLSGTTPLGAPSAPTIGSITVGSSYLQVPFTAPADNGGAAVTGYQYSLDGGTWTTAATSTSPITITGLTNGQAYAVRLRAVNSVGGGAASTPVSATPFGMPAAVQGFRATPTANSVTLEWDTADDNGSPITSYNLIRWSAMTAGSIAQSFPITATSHTVTGLGAGTYYFTIEATNAAGTGPRSTPRTTAIVGGTVPAAPTVSTVTLTDDDLAMSWTAGAANTSPITSYIVQYSTDGSTWTTASSGSSATSASFALPTGGVPSVRVAAVSATGVSAFSAVPLPITGPTVVSAITSSSATVSGGIDPNGGDVTIGFEFADTLAELGTIASTVVAATPGTANGTDVVPVSADLSALDPGHAYVVRLVVSGTGVTTYGVAAPFTTDAVITTSELEFVYTGSPVEPVATVLPYGLALTRTFVGTGDTNYTSSSTAPTEAGTYEMTTVSADPAIGGEEIVTITIAPKPITVTIDALDNTYDGTTVALLSFELDGVVVGDDVEANPSAVFGDLVDPGAGEKTVVLEYELHVDRIIGADAHNYDAGYVQGDLVVTIERASQTLTFTSTAPAHPNTGSTYHPAATSSAGLTPVIAIGAGAGTVCTIAAATVSFVGDGTCEITATQSGDANHEPATAVSQTLVVTTVVEPPVDTPPAILLDLDLEVGAPVANAPVYVDGEGLKPLSPVAVELHSDPVLLGTFTTDADGSFSGTVYLPASVPVGQHHVVVVGEAPDGSPVTDEAALFVDWSGSTGWTQDDGDGPVVDPVLNHFAAVQPVRLLDTRDGSSSKVAAGGVREIAIPAGLVAADASAVVLNITVTAPEGPGFITVYPCDADRPLASVLNHQAGETVANLVTAVRRPGVPLCLYTLAATHVVVDLAGTYGGTGGQPVENVEPVRVADTRDTTRVAAGESLVVDVVGTGMAPEGATAVSLHVAVTGPAGDGYLTVHPCGTDVPLASNLNFRAGQTIGNSTMTGVGAAGTICIYSLVDTDVVVDLNGYAAPSASGTFQALTAGRVLDTRDDGSRQAAGSVVVIDFSAAPTADAVALNVAAVDPGADGFLTVFPCGIDRPLAASVNYEAEHTHGNHVTVAIGADHQVCIYTLSATDIVVDVEGLGLATPG